MSAIQASSSNTVGTAQGLSTDVRNLSTLKHQANVDPHAAIRQTAKQMESLFMQELMKTMRETTMGDDSMDNDGSKLGTEMLDNEYATQMSGIPGGLADMITKQLERQLGSASTNASGAASTTSSAPASTPTASTTSAAPAAASGNSPSTTLSTHALRSYKAGSGSSTLKPSSSAAEFVRTHLAAALNAQSVTGIPAANLIGQAAQESGWGQRQILNADGSSSHNLFGIKAGAGWTGPVAEVATTEYVGGKAQTVTAKFRAYASDAEAFMDHAKLLKNNARYSQVIANGSTAAGYATSLQQAGYATDPQYAQKLTQVINTTVQLQRLIS